MDVQDNFQLLSSLKKKCNMLINYDICLMKNNSITWGKHRRFHDAGTENRD